MLRIGESYSVPSRLSNSVVIPIAASESAKRDFGFSPRRNWRNFRTLK